jgi:hypothetical protein
VQVTHICLGEDHVSTLTCSHSTEKSNSCEAECCKHKNFSRSSLFSGDVVKNGECCFNQVDYFLLNTISQNFPKISFDTQFINFAVFKADNFLLSYIFSARENAFSFCQDISPPKFSSITELCVFRI